MVQSPWPSVTGTSRRVMFQNPPAVAGSPPGCDCARTPVAPPPSRPTATAAELSWPGGRPVCPCGDKTDASRRSPAKHPWARESGGRSAGRIPSSRGRQRRRGPSPAAHARGAPPMPPDRMGHTAFLHLTASALWSSYGPPARRPPFAPDAADDRPGRVRTTDPCRAPWRPYGLASSPRGTKETGMAKAGRPRRGHFPRLDSLSPSHYNHKGCGGLPPSHLTPHPCTIGSFLLLPGNAPPNRPGRAAPPGASPEATGGG
jgi:hypothetical protein